ncbi:hypothetical protein [Aurantiacibacter rhizosphaerae]|uniref:Uncharacterized protein n=1 Tax=Aurantiacibacter rhizosphaerae TaxID=2691582 RepID=A0A844XCW7_9SPHN|nr:hypothetical protein [Aurantiacibacter rhizosphaerae]MWV27474.1 hypothetical protein [Aurantiacibacter rhizosphaerae]
MKRLKKDGPVRFVEQILFDDNAWYFPTRSGAEYADFKSGFAPVFGVSSPEIAVVGSAKFGFSLAPQKGFRAFQPSDEEPNPSDLDVVIVSRPIFNETWHQLRRAHYQGAINAREFFQEDVFRRFIMIGADDERDTHYLRDLSRLMDRVRKEATTKFGITQTIKMRVYASWTDAKAYHIWSMQKLAEHHGIQ